MSFVQMKGDDLVITPRGNLITIAAYNDYFQLKPHGYYRMLADLDEILMRVVSYNEFKITRAVIRYTWGYQQEESNITRAMISDYTGIPKQYVSRSVASLVRRGVLLRKHRNSALAFNKYVVDWADVSLWNKRLIALMQAHPETARSVNNQHLEERSVNNQHLAERSVNNQHLETTGKETKCYKPTLQSVNNQHFGNSEKTPGNVCQNNNLTAIPSRARAFLNKRKENIQQRESVLVNTTSGVETPVSSLSDFDKKGQKKTRGEFTIPDDWLTWAGKETESLGKQLCMQAEIANYLEHYEELGYSEKSWRKWIRNARSNSSAKSGRAETPKQATKNSTESGDAKKLENYFRQQANARMRKAGVA